MNLIIFFFSVSVALLFTSDFRLTISTLTFPIINLFIPIFLLLILLKLLKENVYLKFSRVFCVVVLFLILLNTLFVIHLPVLAPENLYLKFVLKQFVNLLMFLEVYIFFRVWDVNIEKFLLSLVIVSASFISVYILKYLFYYHSPFLGNLFFNPHLTSLGKNQIQIYLSLMIPLNLFLLSRFKNGFKYLLLLSFLVHIFAMFYVGSKGLWVSLFIGLLLTAKQWMNFRIFFLFLIFFVFMAKIVINLGLSESISAWNELFSFLNSSDFFWRDESSYNRLLFIKEALENLSFWGHGIGFFYYKISSGFLTHNDYLFLVVDLGILTLIVYFFFEAIILLLLRKQLFLVLPFFLDLNFINAIDYPLFYVLLAVYLLLFLDGRK